MNDERIAIIADVLDTYFDGEIQSPEESVTDLLANLLHFCDAHALDCDVIYDRAACHYEAERG